MKVSKGEEELTVRMGSEEARGRQLPERHQLISSQTLQYLCQRHIEGHCVIVSGRTDRNRGTRPNRSND